MTPNEKKIIKMWLSLKADPDGPNAAQLFKAIINKLWNEVSGW
jgi:hypothetical protein